MKKTFFSGLAILLPIAVTIAIIVWLIDFITKPFVGIIEKYLEQGLTGYLDVVQHKTLILAVSRVGAIIALFIIIVILGFLGRRFFFSYLIRKIQLLFEKIPYVKKIYKIVVEITKSFVKTEKNSKIFKGTVTVKFPSEDSDALGLITGDAPQEVQKVLGKKCQTVFVPTAPHPISGFLLMLSDDQTKKVDIETEDVFKFLISCGIHDTDKKKR